MSIVARMTCEVEGHVFCQEFRGDNELCQRCGNWTWQEHWERANKDHSAWFQMAQFCDTIAEECAYGCLLQNVPNIERMIINRGIIPDALLFWSRRRRKRDKRRQLGIP